MPRSKAPSALASYAAALAAGAWSELGVSGWASTHGDWAVDPEPLILFTAFLGDADPRLRDEATDWCTRYPNFVSKVRLRNLLSAQPNSVREAFGEFAATVNQHAGTTWPGATTARRFGPTGRSVLPPLDQPSLVWLRLRAIFGIGARTEILRFLLSVDEPGATAARLADAANYTKRNVADEAEALVRAGVLRMRTRGNRFEYSLARREALEAFIGAMPSIRPDWQALFDVARELIELDQADRDLNQRTRAVRARLALRRVASALDHLGIEPPSAGLRGDDLWSAVTRLSHDCLGAWSSGATIPAVWRA